MKKVIYFFSGTGNSMRAADKIAGRLGDTEIISMRNDPLEVPASDHDMIGFVYPVYHWTMPEPAVKFIEKLSVNPKAYIFAVAMPSFISGLAFEKLEEILESKGTKLSYGEKVHSVANYVIVYPPMPSPKLTVPRTERKLDRIANDIKCMKHKAYPRASLFIRKMYPKVMPKYKSLMPYSDYPFTISNDCISCGLCSKVCPCHNIELVDRKPAFLHNCSQCMACVCFCPKRAIGYKPTEEDFKKLANITAKVPILKIMGLPPKRKIYHNTYIAASDMMKSRIKIDGIDKVENEKKTSAT
jgi:ferredoxin/flavodoxin